MKPIFRVSRHFRITNSVFAIACLLALIWFVVNSATGFSRDGFMPHGHCYLWTPSLIWTMVITDALIGMAYVSISVYLYFLVRRIRLPFSTMFLAFGAFIGACGATHFMNIYTLWWPEYWLEALIKVITALASVATAVLLFPLFPKIVGLSAAARLSEERRLQLEKLNLQLQAKTEELLESNRELEAFGYSVSHDLRAPLRAMNGFSEALLAGYGKQLDSTANEYLGHIHGSAERMSRIIDDLLRLSRITRAEIQAQKVDLSAIARQIIAELKIQAPDRKVNISISEGLAAYADPGLIKNVLENLLSNAWKFTSKTTDARIEFGCQANSAGQRIYFVRDNGVGFDMRFSDKLFGVFQRFHSADEFSGTGVGLAIAKRVIDRHRGRIWAESEVGRGTTFYFSLNNELNEP